MNNVYKFHFLNKTCLYADKVNKALAIKNIRHLLVEKIKVTIVKHTRTISLEHVRIVVCLYQIGLPVEEKVHSQHR